VLDGVLENSFRTVLEGQRGLTQTTKTTMFLKLYHFQQRVSEPQPLRKTKERSSLGCNACQIFTTSSQLERHRIGFTVVILDRF
jgi:hypothetical protein